MRVLVVDTGRGVTSEQVLRLRESLGLLPQDEMCWLGWSLPKEPLPVSRHLVLGPRLRNLGVARQVETATGAAPADEIHRRDLPGRDDDGIPARADEQLEERLEEQLPESAQTHHHHQEGRHGGPDTADAGRAALDDASPNPVGPPRARGLAYLVKGTRNTLRRTWRPLKLRLVTSERRPVQVVVGAAQAVYPGIDDQFALAAYRSRSVADLAAGCHVILSHDSRSQAATWLIGRRVPGPALVVGLTAARRVIEEQRALVDAQG